MTEIMAVEERSPLFSAALLQFIELCRHPCMHSCLDTLLLCLGSSYCCMIQFDVDQTRVEKPAWHLPKFLLLYCWWSSTCLLLPLLFPFLGAGVLSFSQDSTILLKLCVSVWDLKDLKLWKTCNKNTLYSKHCLCGRLSTSPRETRRRRWKSCWDTGSTPTSSPSKTWVTPSRVFNCSKSAAKLNQALQSHGYFLI